IPEVERVLLVDPDTYEARNLTGQAITAGDVGQPKAIAQARQLRCIRPDLPVVALVEALEDVPLGILRADVILSCLDSRGARQAANVAAWRVGRPLIDAGVLGSALLARVNVYLPGDDAPCVECAWNDEDYELIAQEYPCVGRTTAPTNAPSSLGALAAALQAIECQNLLRGDHGTLAAACQVMVDALQHRHFVTRLPRNPRCRFDHRTWDIARLGSGPEELTVGSLFGLGADPRATGERRIRVPQQVFASGLVCTACGHRREITLHLAGRLGARDRICQSCGGTMRPAGAQPPRGVTAPHAPATPRGVPLSPLRPPAGGVASA